ncbi:MAG: FtsX-like permease family protein [Luteitalea sp.]|nr:FtsX-like permease family protein [Luteitalea sp.]
MSGLREWGSRLWSTLRRRRRDRELEEELRLHLELATDEARRQGYSPDDARRAARRRAGSIPQAMDALRDQRGLPWLEDLWTDLRYAARTLRKGPGFTTAVVLTFALGIGASTAIFSVVSSVLLEPLPYEEPGRLIRLYQVDTDDPDDLEFVTGVHFGHYRDQIASFEDLAAVYTYRETGADLEMDEGAERIRVLYTSASYFDVLRTQPVRGRAFRRDEETEVPPVMSDDRQNEESQSPIVILSDRLWRRQFDGDPSILGQTLRLSGALRTVIGVMPPGFSDPVIGQVDAWLPLNLRPGGSNNPGNHYLTVLGRLRSGTPIQTARAELATLDRALAERYARQADEEHAQILPLQEDLVGSASRTLQVLLGAVGFVLLLVCVNISNLLFVRGTTRRRELAVRLALGSGGGRIVRQLLTESLLLAVAGGAAGLVVAKSGTAALVSLGSASIPRVDSVSFDTRVLVFATAVTLLSALLAGSAPTLGASRAAPGDALREWSRLSTAGRRSGRARAGLVVTQVALALVLLVGSGLFMASLYRLQQVDLGVRTDDVLTFEVHLPAARYDAQNRARFHEELARRLERLPGVQKVGAVSKLPATGSYHGWPTRAGTGPLAGTEDESTGAQHRVVAGDYFEALAIPVLEGRSFDDRDDADAPRRVVVSRALAERLFPGTDPVGQRVEIGGDPAEVIGVAGDVAIDPEGTVTRYVFHPHRQFAVAANRNWALTYTVAAAVAPETLIPAARRELAALDPRLVLYQPASLAASVGRGTAQRRFTTVVLASFAAAALALAALGLFGVLSYSVRQRRRELGVRMALGARASDVRRLVLGHGATLAASGIVIGLVVSVALTWVLGSLLFEVSPLDPLTFASAAFVLGASALLASWIPAHRAAGVEPIDVLREE